MKKGGSKRKGSQYERTICKQLSLWWSYEENDIIFWLSSQSGGRATTRAKKGKKTPYSYGDITFIDPIGKPLIDKCLLELKRGYTNDINILDLIDKKKGISILLQWWEKGESERKFAKRKYTIVIFRRDRHESCIFFESKIFNEMLDYFGKFDGVKIIVETKDHKFIVLKLDEFLDWCNPKFFKEK